MTGISALGRAAQTDVGRIAVLRVVLSRPVDIGPLIVLRVVFGVLMSAGAVRFMAMGWIRDLYVAPRFHFTYYGFGWVRPLPEWGMWLVFIALAGLEGIAIGETLADPENPTALEPIRVEEPTIRMTFGVNTSPMAGKDGRWGTSRNLRERLFNELQRNVALRVEETESTDTFLVSGRGELHLVILIETMRREGFELTVGRPRVVRVDRP